MSNALKFTEKGTVKVEVQLIPGTQGALIEVAVTDTGCGIAKDHQSKLFEPFTQADPSISRRFGGTGLGLSLSRRLAQALGGDVYLKESNLGQGSTFIATIDPGRFSLEEVINPGDIGDLEPVAPKKPVAWSNPTPLGIKTLIIDDSQDLRFLARKILQASGISVAETDNGRTGAAMALTGHYQVILMDLQMPDLSGEATVALLRAKNYRGRIVALTANAMPGERERCLATGFSDYLAKPFNSQDLVSAVIRNAKIALRPVLKPSKELAIIRIDR